MHVWARAFLSWLLVFDPSTPPNHPPTLTYSLRQIMMTAATMATSDKMTIGITGLFRVYCGSCAGIPWGTVDRWGCGFVITPTCPWHTPTFPPRSTLYLPDGAMNESKAHAELIQPLETRAQVLVSLVGHLCPAVSVRWVPLYEPYGPTIKSNAYDALILSQETLRGGERINQVREENGFQPLDLIVVDCVPDPQDSGSDFLLLLLSLLFLAQCLNVKTRAVRSFHSKVASSPSPAGPK